MDQPNFTPRLPAISEDALRAAHRVEQVARSPDKQQEVLTSLQIQSPSEFFSVVGRIARELIRVNAELVKLGARPPKPRQQSPDDQDA